MQENLQDRCKHNTEVLVVKTDSVLGKAAGFADRDEIPDEKRTKKMLIVVMVVIKIIFKSPIVLS